MIAAPARRGSGRADRAGAFPRSPGSVREARTSPPPGRRGSCGNPRAIRSTRPPTRSFPRRKGRGARWSARSPLRGRVRSRRALHADAVATLIQVQDQVRAAWHFDKNVPRQSLEIADESCDCTIVHHSVSVGAGGAQIALLLDAPAQHRIPVGSCQQRQHVDAAKQLLVGAA